MIQKELQDFINNNSDPYTSDVPLPDSLNNQSVSFYESLDTPTIMFLPLGMIIAILVYFLQLNDYQKKLDRRKEQLTCDYPEIVSKLLLLHGAGLTVKNAFSLIWEDARQMNLSNHFVYREIEYTIHKLKNGASETGAYSEFGKRCGTHIYIKLGSLLEQNIKKGSSDLQTALSQEVQEAFSLHKNETLQAGEKAGTKMLLPMILILIVVMIVVIIPAFFSMTS